MVATAGAPVLHSGAPSCVSASQSWGWREHVLLDAGEALPCRQIPGGKPGRPWCTFASLSGGITAPLLPQPFVQELAERW